MISKKSLSFIGLKKLSAADRMKMVKSPEIGRSLMSSLTPTQIAELFPKYFLRQLPDVGILVSQTARERQIAQEQFQKTVQSATVEKKEGGEGGVWTKIKKKFGFEPDTGKVHKPGEVPAQPAPTLSPEDLMTYNAIKSQPLGADDPKSKFLATLTPEQLKAGGLEKVKDEQTGKEMYRYMPIPEEKVKEEMKQRSARGKGEWAQDTEFMSEVNRVSRKFNIKPNDLLSVMAFESGISSSIRNKIGATGLIQFMPKTAAQMGTTTEALAGMSRAEQMKWVEKYLEMNHIKPGSTAADIYAKVFLPGRSGNDVLTVAGEKYYEQNRGLDRDGDGRITKADLQAAAEAAGRRHGVGLGEAPDREYTGEEVTAFRKKMEEEQSKEFSHVAAIGQLGAATQSTMGAPGAPGVAPSPGLATSKFKMDQGGWVQPDSRDVHIKPGNEHECVTLSRSFNNELPNVGTNGWKISRNDAAIQPGVVVATNMYNSGRASARGQGFHTGVALTRPDKDGNFWMLDQSAGGPAKVRQQNVNNYDYNGRRPNIQGNFFGVVNGNTKQSKEAIAMALNNPGRMPKELVEQLRTDYNNLINNPQNSAPADPKQVSIEANRPVTDTVPPVDKEQPAVTPTITTPSTGAVPDFTQAPGVPPTAAPIPAEAPTAAPVKPEEKKKAEPPKPMAGVYRVDPKSFREASKPGAAREGYSGWMVDMASDEDIRTGFNNNKDAIEAGAYIDENWKLHIKDVNHPKVKGVLEEYKGNVLTDITPKPKEEPKKVEPPKAEPKIEASVTTAPPAQPTTAEPPTIKQFVKGEGYAGLKDVPNPKYVPPQQQAPTAQAQPAPAAPAPAPKPAETPATSVSVKPTGTPEQNKPATPPTAPAPTATAEPKKEEPPKVPAKAEGGKVETGTGDISVYPIGGLRGDNAIAKDTNTAEPLFTMNTNRESVTPTGENGRANITPTAKDLNAAPVPQMNPMDALSAEIDNLRQQLATQGQPEGNQPAKPMQRTVTDRDPKMIDGLLDLTRQTFRNPTSERAFSRNNFQETGHAVTGGHYSLGNTTQA